MVEMVYFAMTGIDGIVQTKDDARVSPQDTIFHQGSKKGKSLTVDHDRVKFRKVCDLSESSCAAAERFGQLGREISS
jgi:hypothetical protein